MDGGLYTARDVARVIGIAESRLAYWVRSGLVSPSVKRGGRGWFRFEELIAIKAAFELTERGVSLQSVRRNLRALRGAIPSPQEGDGPLAAPRPQPLSRLRVVSDGEQLVVVNDDVAFEPLSGQVVMDFVVGSLSQRAAEVLALPPPAGPERSAWQWWQEALALEERGHDALAESALRHAIAADPAFAAAHNNLGSLAYRAGRHGEAREHYQRALDLDPAQPEARYNLANLLDQSGDHQGAIREWTRVTALDPAFADAHFNLGATLSTAPADSARACFHLLRYLEIERSGEWSNAARALLDQRRSA